MTTREKVIVVTTGLVVSWGCVVYLLPLLRTSSEPAVSAVTTADAALVERLRLQIESVRLTDAENYILAAAQSAWPARPPTVHTDVHAATVTSPKPIDFQYTGFVNAGSGVFAIINGREYQRGDALQGGAGVVERIAVDHVVLLLENGNRRQVVPFQKKPGY